jgi:peptidyl-Asp metalloendopeptidase
MTTLKVIRVFKKIKHLSFLILIPLCLGVSTLAKAVTVDLLVLYDTEAKNYLNGNPDAAIRGWVSTMNSWYRDSNVDVQINLVGTRQREVSGNDMGPVLSTLKDDSNVASLRNQYGADFVSQVTQKATNYCGIAYQALNQAWAFSVVAAGCGAGAMIHELGHNMGLAHSRKQGDTSGAVYRYGVGYGVQNSFVTIMAYEQSFNARTINRFSDPSRTCNGYACGVAVGQPEESHSTQALNNSKNTMAGFKPSAGGGSGTVVIRARGTSGQETLRLLVNGKIVSTWTLSTSMQNHSVNVSSINANFAVDFNNDASGRDVQVDYIQVNGQTRQSENQSFNSGVYQSGRCGGGNGRSEWMHCNGQIRY